jgi:RimJ/RimL family protein N-acetyltransferase
VIVQPLSDDHAAAIAVWHYEPPYDFYDMDADPEDLADLLDIAQRSAFRAVIDDDGRLVGWFWFGRRDDEVEVGVGLRPDLTGRGLGMAFAESALDYARREWEPATFRLYVAAFNERARRVYTRLGFRIVGRQTRTFEHFGEVEFVEMERPA